MVYKSCYPDIGPLFIQYVNSDTRYFNLNGRCRITLSSCKTNFSSVFPDLYWWERFRQVLDRNETNKELFKDVLKQSYNTYLYWWF